MGSAPKNARLLQLATGEALRLQRGSVGEKMDVSNLLLTVVVPRSTIGVSIIKQELHRQQKLLTPIFLKSDSISLGFAPPISGAAGKPRYLEIPERRDTSLLYAV